MADPDGSLQRRLARARADHRWATAERQRIEQQVTHMRAHQQQHVVDAEVAKTRQILLHALHRRGLIDAVAFLDADFLAVADRPTIVAAVLDAALNAAAADSTDLQIYDPGSATLRMEAQRGFSDDFLAFFATVDSSQSTACMAALVTRQAMLVDDVTRSPIFVGQPTLPPLRAAGSRAVHSYPLLAADGQVHAVLSLHYRRPAPPRGLSRLVAAGAAQALAPIPSHRPQAVLELA